MNVEYWIKTHAECIRKELQMVKQGRCDPFDAMDDAVDFACMHMSLLAGKNFISDNEYNDVGAALQEVWKAVKENHDDYLNRI